MPTQRAVLSPRACHDTFALIMVRSSPRRLLRAWPAGGVQTLFIEPGSPWENGYVESFNGKLADELLDRRSDTLLEAKVLIDRWRVEYNTRRPHSSLATGPPRPRRFWIRRLPLRSSSDPPSSQSLTVLT